MSKGKFNYNYSSEQQKEIEAIRSKYIINSSVDEIDKMEQLRRLDSSVSNRASIVALVIGVISVLIMGGGMSLIMTDMGVMLGIDNVILPGIIIGVVGMCGVISAYPLYNYILRKERKKAAPRILKLTEELTQKIK